VTAVGPLHQHTNAPGQTESLPLLLHAHVWSAPQHTTFGGPTAGRQAGRRPPPHETKHCGPASTPASGLPASGLPESGLPESELPESDLPESELPESDLPESELPESDLPESELPESELPESDLPESGWPGFPESCAAGASRLPPSPIDPPSPLQVGMGMGALVGEHV